MTQRMSKGYIDSCILLGNELLTILILFIEGNVVERMSISALVLVG